MAVALAEFRTRFNEFADIADDKVEMFLNDSVVMINSSCPNADLIAYYLTAHQLATVGKMGTDGADEVNRGAENLIDTGDVKTSYHKLDSDVKYGVYSSTIYGKNYYELMQKCRGLGSFIIA